MRLRRRRPLGSTWWGGAFFRRHTFVGAAPAGPRYVRRRAPAMEEEVEVIEEGPPGAPPGPPPGPPY